MARKPITYAHKRNRNKCTTTLQTQSSPIKAIANPEEQLSYAEMSRRMLKRSRQVWKAPSSDCGQGQEVEENIEQVSKKPRLVQKSPIMDGSKSPSCRYVGLRTPQRTDLTEEQIFRIESSRGMILPPDYEFSPVPPASSLGSLKQTVEHGKKRNRKSSRKTSSSNLKENAIPSCSKFLSNVKSGGPRRKSKSKSSFSSHGLYLASPFASKPSSPSTSSTENVFRQEIPLLSCPKRTLSDTHYNSNLPPRRLLPQTQSTSTTPLRHTEDEAIKSRRPSAPSAVAQRPDVTSWFPTYSSIATFRDHIISSSDFSLFGLGHRERTIDFNRPPSQLSCNFEYDEAFFGDALKISTPFAPKIQRSSGTRLSEFPDAMDDDKSHHSHTFHSPETDITSPLTLPSDVFGSWLSDSLISPPKPSRQSAYMRSVPFDEDIVMSPTPQSLDDSLFESTIMQVSSHRTSEGVSTCGALDENEEESSQLLQELFNKLELGLNEGDSRPPVLRTRSLDLEAGRVPDEQLLHSPARISPSKANNNSNDTIAKRVGRDRRGTVRASDFVASGSNALGGPKRTRSGTVVQGPTRPRRDRSDTVIARPANLGGSTSHINVTSPKQVGTMDDQAPQEPSDLAMLTGEQEDELLLKDSCIGEEWVVAAPPSPILPRRKNQRKGMPDWWKRFEQRNKFRTSSAGHSDSEDGKDDPLLLWQ